LTELLFLLQHFCVIDKDYLRMSEPAWIPTNYGTRVQKKGPF
jgi:hypothetical protein